MRGFRIIQEYYRHGEAQATGENQIDYITINKRFKNAIHQAKT